MTARTARQLVLSIRLVLKPFEHCETLPLLQVLASWQVKKNGDNSKEDEHSRPLGDSCFTNPSPENTPSPSLSSREQLTAVSDTECEDSGPQKDDLQRIIELMDGFKASKVNQTHLWHSCNVKRYQFNFHCTPNCKDSSSASLLSPGVNLSSQQMLHASLVVYFASVMADRLSVTNLSGWKLEDIWILCVFNHEVDRLSFTQIYNIFSIGDMY